MVGLIILVIIVIYIDLTFVYSDENGKNEKEFAEINVPPNHHAEVKVADVVVHVEEIVRKSEQIIGKSVGNSVYQGDGIHQEEDSHDLTSNDGYEQEYSNYNNGPDQQESDLDQDTSAIGVDSNEVGQEELIDVAFEYSERREAVGDSTYYGGNDHRLHELDDIEEGNEKSHRHDEQDYLQNGNDEGKAAKEEEEEEKEIDTKQNVGKGGRKGKRGKGGGKTVELVDDFTRDWNISEEMRRLAPVVFKNVPPRFQPGYQGFCWSNAEHAMRCLPYFYLLGMPKCGTTDIWDRL
ncbi:hypothetical protein BSL78_07737 [Apostichopus japonicus]|uniref:Uncharacterized protein n=1 Tax=Stichopus japonicus TaxID=307972 RepID=A0A2G8L527_STIJA|nr:hypothetical protein BSL78_07737 [Apostichopus japonicus]